MEFLKEFNRIMENTHNIALATSVNDIPNVRLMIYHYDANKKGIAYISTDKGSNKTLEFLQNSKVAFTTVPVGSNEHVRITNGTIQKSCLKTAELLESYFKKYPGIEAAFAHGTDSLEVYEIHFNEVSVTLGFNQHFKITL